MKNFIQSARKIIKDNPTALLFLLMLVLCPLVGTYLVGITLKSGNIGFLNQFSILQRVEFFVLTGGIMAFGLVPTTVVAYASGFVWGWSSLPFMVLSYGFAQGLGYFISKKVGVDKLFESILSLEIFKSKLLVLKTIRNQWLLVFFCRLSPVLPFGLMNYVLSVMQIRLSPFLISGLFGMLPRTMFFIWIGTQSKELLLSPVTNFNQKVFWLVISALSVFAIMKILTNQLKKSIIVQHTEEN